jgi:DNA-directed RNA polymerase beta' subunit
MKVDLVSIKKVIAINNLRRVTNPIIFDRGGVPTSDGLLSTELCGLTTNERKETYTYIDLNDHFLHPKAYKDIKRLDRRVDDIIAGTKKFIIDEKGQIIEDEENGQTGIRFLYKNWEKIKFIRNDSNSRNERINMLEAYPKDVIFTRYWLVCPAFYRDVNFKNYEGGKLSHNKLTDKYSKLLKFANMLESISFDFMMYNTQYSIQQQLVDIYNFLKEKQEKKNGMIRKSLLGKSIDYGARSVITAPRFNLNQKVMTSFKYTGVPLAQLCSLFFPFVMYYLKRWVSDKQIEINGFYNDKKVQDLNMYYDEQKLKAQVDKFIFSYSERFELVEVPVIDEGNKHKEYFDFEGIDENGNEIKRKLTWCDIIYQSVYEATLDKHVWITRYPLIDYFGTFTTRISVLSTVNTMYMKIGDKVYESYPHIDLTFDKKTVSTYFLDTLALANVYLPGLGGDYDGDQVTIKSVFSQEANAECEKIMLSNSNILNICGKNVRETTNEGIQTIYMLTRFAEE